MSAWARVADLYEVELRCGHSVLFSQPVPAVGDYVSCLACRAGAHVVAKVPATKRRSVA